MTDTNDKRVDDASHDAPSISATPASPTNARSTVETPVKSHEQPKSHGHNTSNSPMNASALVGMIITPQQALPSSNNMPSNNRRRCKAEADGDTDAEGTASGEVILPAEAAVLAEIVALRDRDSMLLSDFSILRGEFCKTEYKNDPNHKFIREFRECGLDNFIAQFELYEDLKKLEKYLKAVRQARANGELTFEQRADEGREVDYLKALNEQFEEKKKKITDLRIALEKLGKEKGKYYPYPLDIHFQVIGNQEVPANAKAKRRRSTNGVKSEGKSDGKRGTPGDDSSDEFDATPSRPTKKGKKNDGTAARKAKPPPTLSSLFPKLFTASSPKTSGSATHASGSHSTPTIAPKNLEAPIAPEVRGSRARQAQALSQVEDASKIDASNEIVAILKTQEVERNVVLIEKSNADVFRKQAEESHKQVEKLQKEIEELKRAKEALQ
jgi:hypothetical protein